MAKPPFRLLRPPTGPFRLNRNSVQAAGLVGWWPAAGSVGTAVHRNLALQTPNGTIQTAYTSWVATAEHGHALRLDTTIDRKQKATLTDFYIPNDFTIVCSLIPLAQVTDRNVAAVAQYIGGTNANNGWLLGMNYYATNTDHYPFFSVRFSDATQTSIAHTTQWTGGQHLFLAGVRRGTTLTLYRSLPSGQLVSNSAACSAATINNSTLIPTLGTIDASNGFPTNADYIDTRAYSRALSADEVWQLHDPATRWELYQPISHPRMFVGFSPSAPGDPLISATDSVSVGDLAALTISDPQITVVDGATVADIPTVTLPEIGGIELSATDNVTAADSVSVSALLAGVSVTDGATLADAVTLAMGDMLVSVSDAATVADFATAVLSDAAVNVSDGASLADTAQAQVSDPQIAVTDGATLADAPAVTVSAFDLGITIDPTTTTKSGVRIWG